VIGGEKRKKEKKSRNEYAQICCLRRESLGNLLDAYFQERYKFSWVFVLVLYYVQEQKITRTALSDIYLKQIRISKTSEYFLGDEVRGILKCCFDPFFGLWCDLDITASCG
jgi:hypothetical protein